MKIRFVTLRGLIKLRMMGVAIWYYTHIGHNITTSKPDFTLNKNSYTVCHEKVQESVAMGKILSTYIPELKKQLIYSQKFRQIASPGIQ